MTVEGQSCDVVELSEGGLRLSPVPDAMVKGQQVQATLKLLSGKPQQISASFARSDQGEAVFENLTGISFAEMMNEQRYLIRKYPAVKEG